MEAHRLPVECKKCGELFCLFCRAGVCTACHTVDSSYFIEYEKAIRCGEPSVCGEDVGLDDTRTP